MPTPIYFSGAPTPNRRNRSATALNKDGANLAPINGFSNQKIESVELLCNLKHSSTLTMHTLKREKHKW